MGPTNLQQAAQPYNNPPPNGLNNTNNVSPTIGVNPNINTNINPNFNNNVNIIIPSEQNIPPLPLFGYEPVKAYCSQCGKTAMTQPRRRCNIKAFLCAVCSCFIGFACLQLWRKKNVNCDDCEHYCPEGHKLGVYYTM
jgi:hypothetical protein